VAAKPRTETGRLDGPEGIDDDLALDRLNGIDDDRHCSRMQALE
jgi:hypothetical protein